MTDITEYRAPVIELSSVQCEARSKQTGEQCGNKAIPGGNVCRFHGGAAPQVQAAALSRILQARDLALDRLIERLAPPTPDEDGFFPNVDTKVLLDVVDKLTVKVQLLTGQATSREESTKVEEVRNRLELSLSRISPRLQAAVDAGVIETVAIEEEDDE